MYVVMHFDDVCLPVESAVVSYIFASFVIRILQYRIIYFIEVRVLYIKFIKSQLCFAMCNVINSRI